jgi:hypothetical protein
LSVNNTHTILNAVKLVEITKIESIDRKWLLKTQILWYYNLRK